MRALPLLCLAAVLTGCSGFSIGVRQDKEDAERFGRVLARAPLDRPFPVRDLLDRGFTRLFVFEGGGSTQEVEDRIRIPFPQSGEEIADDAAYVVFADAEEVVAAFTYRGAPGATGRCLVTARVPLGPDDEVVEVRPAAGGPAELSPVPTASRCR
ncbi:MAG: hypothetical protein JWO90_141 [Solirubrobacterales bacterium]|nr:hypothetical protein [Solirubrobacterales bacterium]